MEELKGTDRVKVVGDVDWHPTIDQLKAYIKPYKSYIAALTQSGASAPVATVVDNELGDDVVWTRSSDGEYQGTLVGAFPANKIWCALSIFGSTSASFAFFARANELSCPDAINIQTLDDTLAPVDFAGASIMVEIRVYP